jgi:FkbM family methyltransferase
MKIVNVCGHSFIKDLLGEQALVLDCGANRGEFSSWIAGNCKATVHGFEPDFRLFPNLPVLSGVYYYPLAISSTGESLTLRLGEERCSTACFSEKPDQPFAVVDSVKLDEFCLANSLSRIDIIKMDIEGAEIDALSNLASDFLDNVGQITVEFHDFIRKDDLPRIREVISRLKKCGFFCIRFSYHDYADVLCINTKVHPLSWSDFLCIYVQKYYRGVARILCRMLGTNRLGTSKT